MDPASLWQLASPFVAAGVASALTYRVTVAGKRYDLAQAERLAAFRVLKSQLLSLKRYAEGRAADIDGGDYEFRSNDIPEAERRSFLEHYEVLRRTRDEYEYILPSTGLDALNAVTSELGLICSMQITMDHSDSAQLDSAAEMYRRLAEECGSAVSALYSSLQLPR